MRTSSWSAFDVLWVALKNYKYFLIINTLLGLIFTITFIYGVVVWNLSAVVLALLIGPQFFIYVWRDLEATRAALTAAKEKEESSQNQTTHPDYWLG